ncbi:nitroreductase family protein [Clostridium estertheticum]|uniref:nitroreductase family protein n=1 Tax=Clostridium estertheticum TaxID=238834 RepID=UPI001C7CAF1E|nr:nitroreductase family protein [Clostridium estertheticum]MBX4264532.1 nitroreductase [Clostridium estertheticum]WLC88676.1 nitroreductase [Clostridium estertheticum]
MEFQKSVIELIKMRTSSRSFDQKNIESLTLKKLKDYIKKSNEETKLRARVIVIQSNDNDSRKAKKLGTYGVISGANSFIIGIFEKEEKDALEFGYLFEKIILFATDLGLQTCWLGGTFNKGNFEENMSLVDNEFIPIVSPVGIKKEKPRVFESVMRKVIGANKRKPWSELFFETDSLVPLSEGGAGQYAVPLEMVRLGPSASNKQPWRIIKDENAYHFFLCRTKGYGVTGYDMQKNDIGIAKCHFELSANELGLKGTWVEIKNISTPNDWEYCCSWSN